MIPFHERKSSPPRSPWLRTVACLRGQVRLTPRCPDWPRLDGVPALVTGGNRGIGLETSRGLARFGARVIAASRKREQPDPAVSTHAALDLADLESVAACVRELAERFKQPLRILVLNAGLWPTRHATSAQGHEIAFATNVLGHHALIRALLEAGLLASDARVVVVTGDIYCLASDCTPDFTYRGVFGCMQAYSRSKLGNLWFAGSLARRYPALTVCSVHPGVVASELSGSHSGPTGWFKRALMLPPESGAETSVYCATQPGIESGGYYHNTLGRVVLQPEDPAADSARAEPFWDLLEKLSRS